MGNKMKNYNQKLKIGFYFLVFVFTFSFLIFSFAGAQQAPELMVTWKADNYVPSDYQGKALPSSGTGIEMAVELIDGGKLADLSRYEIRWSVNKKLKQSGVGLKNFSFITDRFQGAPSVAVTVVNYRGGDLQKNITIPLVSPEAAIDGRQGVFEALPYFFNVRRIAELDFQWSANDQETSGAIVESPNILNLSTANVPSETVIDLSVTVRNIRKPTEISTESFSFVKQ